MRTFTRDVENRLDRAYKSGAGKKYGYEGITQQSQATPSTGSAESKYEDRMLNKIQSQAQQYIEKSSTMSTSFSTLSITSGSTTSKPSSLMIKADHSIGLTQNRPLRVKQQQSTTKKSTAAKAAVVSSIKQSQQHDSDN